MFEWRMMLLSFGQGCVGRAVIGTILLMTMGGCTVQSPSFETLDKEWQSKAVIIDTKGDPRTDLGQLRPVVNFDQEIIEIDGYGSNWLGMVGEGWQLVGSIVDVAIEGDFEYILFGRRNIYYAAGIWNNRPDANRSFYDYLVVRRTQDKAEVIERSKLTSFVSQILLGLRKSADGRSIEVIQNTKSGAPQVIWANETMG